MKFGTKKKQKSKFLDIMYIKRTIFQKQFAKNLLNLILRNTLFFFI